MVGLSEVVLIVLIFWSRVLRRLPTSPKRIRFPEGQGTLISEPRFFYPLQYAIFPMRYGEKAIFKEKPSTMAIFPLSREKNRMSQGVENRGSLISVPLALRFVKVCSRPSGYLHGSAARSSPTTGANTGRTARVLATCRLGRAKGSSVSWVAKL